MDPLADRDVRLLGEARAAGLTVRAQGEDLVVEGPRRLGGLAERLLADKPGVLAVLAGEVETEVAWRVAVMAPQVPATGTIPFLVARECKAGPTDCLSCGDQMEAGQRYRCRACAEAAQRVVAADEAARVVQRTTGGRP